LYDSFAQQTMSVEPEPKFQTPAPAIQTFFGSTAQLAKSRLKAGAVLRRDVKEPKPVQSLTLILTFCLIFCSKGERRSSRWWVLSKMPSTVLSDKLNIKIQRTNLSSIYKQALNWLVQTLIMIDTSAFLIW